MAFADLNAITAFFTKLDELNGLESYVPSEVPDEVLTGNRLMAIPGPLLAKARVVAANEVGMSKKLDAIEVFHVAAINYTRLHTAAHPHAIEVALLRALIASKGFRIDTDLTTIGNNEKVLAHLTKRPEILYTAYPPQIKTHALGTKAEVDVIPITKDRGMKLADIHADLKPLVEYMNKPEADDLVMLATLLPIFASIEFQKTNHHYIDNDFYRESYAKHFKSAQQADLAEKYNKASLIYDAVHWLGPQNMEDWKQNLCGTTHVPRGIKIKANVAPAGTALVMTQLAVWAAIEVFPGASGLLEVYKPQLDRMKALAADIKKPNKRLTYHVFCSLFGVNSSLESDLAKDGLSAAGQLAAVAQAFIDTIAKGSDLARAKALSKHAQQNIGLFKIAEAAFKGTQARLAREARTKTLSEAIVPAIKAAPEEPARVEEVPEVV